MMGENVLLPTGKFIIDRQGDTLLEFVAMVASKPYYITANLEAKSDIKVFGYVALRPVNGISISVGIWSSNVLDSCP
jgi:hypothetical protein